MISIFSATSCIDHFRTLLFRQYDEIFAGERASNPQIYRPHDTDVFVNREKIITAWKCYMSFLAFYHHLTVLNNRPRSITAYPQPAYHASQNNHHRIRDSSGSNLQTGFLPVYTLCCWRDASFEFVVQLSWFSRPALRSECRWCGDAPLSQSAFTKKAIFCFQNR